MDSTHSTDPLKLIAGLEACRSGHKHRNVILLSPGRAPWAESRPRANRGQVRHISFGAGRKIPKLDLYYCRSTM